MHGVATPGNAGLIKDMIMEGTLSILGEYWDRGNEERRHMERNI